MALSADITDGRVRARSATTRTYEVKNAQAMYRGGLCGLDANGLLVPWDDTAITQRFLGIFEDFIPALTSGVPTTVGNTSAEPVVRGRVRCDGAEVQGIDVAGVSARASVGEPVYATSDDITRGSGAASLTLTPTAFVKPVGRLIDFHSTSDMDIRLLTPEEYHAYGSFGSWSRYVNLATLADGDMVTTWTPGFRGRIIKWWFEVMIAVTTGSKASTLNLEVGTTNLTGGTIALTSANCTPHGTIVAQGSAFTAGMAFGAADTISIEAASTTTFVEGTGNLIIEYQADE